MSVRARSETGEDTLASKRLRIPANVLEPDVLRNVLFSAWKEGWKTFFQSVLQQPICSVPPNSRLNINEEVRLHNLPSVKGVVYSGNAKRGQSEEFSYTNSYICKDDLVNERKQKALLKAVVDEDFRQVSRFMKSRLEPHGEKIPLLLLYQTKTDSMEALLGLYKDRGLLIKTEKEYWQYDPRVELSATWFALMHDPGSSRSYIPDGCEWDLCHASQFVFFEIPLKCSSEKLTKEVLDQLRQSAYPDVDDLAW